MRWLWPLIIFCGVMGMAERVTGAQRVKLANVAEREIMRHADDHALWFKHVLGVDLDPIQEIKMELMDKNPFTLDPSCRRTRKTSTKELYNLKKCATEPDHGLSILAPREDQAKTGLNYHLEGIRNSEILNAYIAIKEGKRRISDTSYTFHNGSTAQVFGMMSKMDGIDTTIASVDEVDDLIQERLWNRFMLTLGASQKLYQKRQGNINKTARFTGVFQGLDLMSNLCAKSVHCDWNRKLMPHLLRALNTDGNGDELEGYRFFCLPIIDVHLGLQFGTLDEATYQLSCQGLTEDQYKRAFLCIPTEGRNFFKERHLRMMQKRGLMAGLEPAPPIPGARYQKRGLVVICFDKGGHGESESASKNSAHVLEQWGNYTLWLWGKEWPADEDDKVIERELVDWWRYYRPDGGMGDAFGASLLADLNDILLSEGLIDTDRREFGGSSASSWEHWAFAPQRMEGMQKHLMYTSLERGIRGGTFLTPLVSDDRRHDPGYEVLARLIAQLGNIKSEKTRKAYDSYSAVKKQLGDDNPDAVAFGIWWLVNRGAIMPPAFVDSLATGREAVLSGASRLEQMGRGIA